MKGLPRGSMGLENLFTYIIDHQDQLNVGKYTIHGSCGLGLQNAFQEHRKRIRRNVVRCNDH